MAAGAKTLCLTKIIWTNLNWEESNMRSIASSHGGVAIRDRSAAFWCAAQVRSASASGLSRIGARKSSGCCRGFEFRHLPQTGCVPDGVHPLSALVVVYAFVATRTGDVAPSVIVADPALFETHAG